MRFFEHSLSKRTSWSWKQVGLGRSATRGGSHRLCHRLFSHMVTSSSLFSSLFHTRPRDPTTLLALGQTDPTHPPTRVHHVQPGHMKSTTRLPVVASCTGRPVPPSATRFSWPSASTRCVAPALPSASLPGPVGAGENAELGQSSELAGGPEKAKGK